ncbi:hypothetical protein D915_010250 [Fasciola hepatica]|uniref:Saposin-like type B region 1 domain-containing protein n=1 Tax=Fasciola hepatica TaxID=6192 RepID=A0A4E0RQ97_FASHE|nr:hypothetical protein D915_010250 [Fasciola hepatica]
MNPLVLLVLATVALANPAVKFQQPDEDVSPCEVCTAAIDRVKTLLESGTVKTEIEKLMENVCVTFGTLKWLHIIIAGLKDRFRTRLTVLDPFSRGFVANHPPVPFANLTNPRDKKNSPFLSQLLIYLQKVTFIVAIHFRPTKSKRYIFY